MSKRGMWVLAWTLTWSASAAANLVVEPPPAQAQVAEARRLLAEGKAAEAIAAFQAVLRLDPNNGGAHHALGSLFNNAGNYPAAIVHAEAAVRAELGNSRFRYGRGVVLAELGRFEEAIADFDAALTANPKLGYAWLERGAAKLSLGREKAAHDDWRQAALAEPQLIWTDWYRATGHMVAGRYTEAAESFRRVAAAEPASTQVQAWLALAELRAGRQAAVSPVAGDEWPAPLINFLRGTLSTERLIEQAAQHRVSGDARRLGEAHYFIAQQAWAQGRKAEAAAHFRQAAAVVAPRHVWKLSAERELERLTGAT